MAKSSSQICQKCEVFLSTALPLSGKALMYKRQSALGGALMPDHFHPGTRNAHTGRCSSVCNTCCPPAAMVQRPAAYRLCGNLDFTMPEYPRWSLLVAISPTRKHGEGYMFPTLRAVVRVVCGWTFLFVALISAAAARAELPGKFTIEAVVQGRRLEGTPLAWSEKRVFVLVRRPALGLCTERCPETTTRPGPIFDR